MKPKTISELNKAFNDAIEVDSAIFAEQRSNILLASGDHYNKRHSAAWTKLRDSPQFSEETKLRITKNHIHRICNIYVNNIYSLAPDVGIVPKNEKELQDQKLAELHSSIWVDWKQKTRFREKVRQYCDDFVKVGEVGVKLFWNPSGGKLLGYHQALDEETGEPQFDEQGQPVAGETAQFTGALEIERIMGMNIFRDPNSKDFYDSWSGFRKMVDTSILEERYKDDEEKLKFVKGGSDKNVYTVFDGSSGQYEHTKNQTMVREHYYPVSEDYAEGYFYICTEAGILEEGVLPFGVFPLIVEGFDEIQTSPRKRSIIKQLRPCQAELNRAASQAAMHQITVGDDKLLVQSGTKVSQASKLPGVRVMTYAGAPPTFLSGRTGEQFTNYIQNQQQEMYDIANLQEEMQDKQSPGNIDPFAELFKSIRHKKKYALYGEKIESFLKRICEVVLEYSKNYLSDEQLIDAIGVNEQGNIPELRNKKSVGFEIKIESQSEDVESKMGKQITLTNTLQYVGSKLDKEDIGKILRVMPFVNREKIFEDYTSDFDNVTNDILALDRGEVPTSNPYDNHKYIIKKLITRTKQPDFKFLPPQIQGAYQSQIAQHEQLETEQLQQIKAAEADFIPSSGYLVGCDFYVTDPENPSRTRRARIPYEALTWLVKRLEQQGTELSQLETMQQGAVSDMATMSGHPPMPPPQGPHGPVGAAMQQAMGQPHPASPSGDMYGTPAQSRAIEGAPKNGLMA